MKTRIRQLTEQEKRSLGEQQMIVDWLKIFQEGILSMVCDTFSTWQFIEYLKNPEIKELVLNRKGKLVVRSDSGDPVDIICGTVIHDENYKQYPKTPAGAGVIELLWDIFGGTINEQGFKVLDPHIGGIYGDSITPERQRQIYERLAAKGFAATNIVLSVGGFTYQYNTRDTLGFACKGAWFEVKEQITNNPSKGALMEHPLVKKSYNIYKDPVTDDGTKKSLKGLLSVIPVVSREELEVPITYKTRPIKSTLVVKEECTFEEESQGLLQVIYEDGKFFNTTTLEEVRQRLIKQ